MKTPASYLFFLCIFILIQNVVTAQEKSNFELAKNSFNTMYEGAIVKEWELEENNIYEVEFIYNGLKYETDYNEKGEWIYTERDLKTNEIPQSVFESFKSSPWSGWAISEVEEIQTPMHKLLYEIKLKNNEEKQYLYYYPDGNLFKSNTDEIF